MRQLDRPDLRGFVPRQKPSEFRLVLKLTRPENHSLERRKAFLPGGWIFLSTRGRILISANGHSPFTQSNRNCVVSWIVRKQRLTLVRF